MPMVEVSNGGTDLIFPDTSAYGTRISSGDTVACEIGNYFLCAVPTGGMEIEGISCEGGVVLAKMRFSQSGFWAEASLVLATATAIKFYSSRNGALYYKKSS